MFGNTFATPTASPAVTPSGSTTNINATEAPSTKSAAAAREMYRALYDYTAAEANEITFKAGDVIRLVKRYKDTEWCKGELKGKVGFFPTNYCELLKLE
jgi:hypothetical protein